MSMISLKPTTVPYSLIYSISNTHHAYKVKTLNSVIWNEIKSSIHNAMNMFIPKVRLRRHQFPCWYTPELRHLSKCLHSTKKRFTKHATPHIQLKISNLESEYRSKILLAKPNYESQLVQSFAGSHNSKIYDYISNHSPCCFS